MASHASNLREVHVDGLMPGWTLGGYPSPNLEVVAAIGKDKYRKALIGECNVAETIAIHCRSVANQAKFITLRDRLASQRGKGVLERC